MTCRPPHLLHSVIATGEQVQFQYLRYFPTTVTTSTNTLAKMSMMTIHSNFTVWWFSCCSWSIVSISRKRSSRLLRIAVRLFNFLGRYSPSYRVPPHLYCSRTNPVCPRFLYANLHHGEPQTLHQSCSLNCRPLIRTLPLAAYVSGIYLYSSTRF